MCILCYYKLLSILDYDMLVNNILTPYDDIPQVYTVIGWLFTITSPPPTSPFLQLMKPMISPAYLMM